MRFESGELRAFRAVVEEGSFKAAAEALSISQSAVSQAVTNLEAKLDMPLMARGRSGDLTPAGKRVFDHAVDVLAGEARTLEELARLRAGGDELLSLALSSSINRFYAPQLVSLFHQRRPQARMRVAEMPSRSIVSAVSSGAVELGLGPFQKHMPAFDQVALYDDVRHLVVSPRHPQFDAIVAADPDALRSTPLIASALDNPDMRPSIARLRDRFSSVWEVSSLSLRIYMIEQGMGVTFFDGKLLREHPQCRELRLLDELSFGRIDKQVGLYFRSKVPLSSAAGQFVDVCREYWGIGAEQC